MGLTEFEEFWQHYPRRVGKFAAMKAYEKARRHASAGEILAGVRSYTRHKPDYADWAHPSSWLNAGRWLDEYEPLPAFGFESFECAHEPLCSGRNACYIKTRLDAMKAHQ